MMDPTSRHDGTRTGLPGSSGWFFISGHPRCGRRLCGRRRCGRQAIDKAGDILDDKTQGKYKDTVDKVQEEAKKAVDKGNPNT